jgi:hypothetical protein
MICNLFYLIFFLDKHLTFFYLTFKHTNYEEGKIMDVKGQLMLEKNKLLKQISESALHGNSQDVLTASEKLNKIEVLINRYEKLLRDITDLEIESHKPQPLEDIPIASRPMKNNNTVNLDTAGRGIGRTIRMSFLKNAFEAGYHLEHIRGSIYKTELGHKIGIAVATERKSDRWFLGLPLNNFDHAVLLCNSETGDTIEICLPKNFFDEYGSMMSQSGGQMKFNVSRRGSGYSILVPGTDGINVSKFIQDYSLLR